jgi:uncharacterized delta-60 repeat protein
MKRKRISILVAVAVAVVFTSGLSAASGELDPTFGAAGKVVTDLGPYDEGAGAALQPDGKTVVAGYTYDPATGASFSVARYNKDGALDASFGSGGTVRTVFGGTYSSSAASSVAIQQDGKIVVAGGAYVYGVSADSEFALARYNTDGTLDSSFGVGGKVMMNLNHDDYAEGLAIQPDGKIVAVGGSGAGNDSDFSIARVNPDGSLDGGFGAGGIVTTPFAGNDYADAVLIQRDGRIVAAGSSNGTGFALARYNSDGSLDGSFDGDGKVELQDQLARGASGIAAQPDGKFVVAGGFIAARYNGDGSLDSSFGEAGRAQVTGFPAFQSVLIQADRKIVIAGAISTSDGYDFGVARLDEDGAVDPDFGAGGEGIAQADFGTGTFDFPRAALLQRDNRIVVVGRTSVGNGPSDIAVARFQNFLSCVVPDVRGKKLAAAKSSIKKALCRVGKVTRKRSKAAKKGRVLSQRPKAGATVLGGTKVNLVLGKGRKR